MLKHVIVERPKAGMVDGLEDLAMELRALMTARGWVHYRAWKAVGDVDAGEPPLFDVGILNRVTDAGLVAFEADFPDRASLEAQLQAMRNDPDVVKILVRAAELCDRDRSRSYVLDAWEPEPR